MAKIFIQFSVSVASGLFLMLITKFINFDAMNINKLTAAFIIGVVIVWVVIWLWHFFVKLYTEKKIKPLEEKIDLQQVLIVRLIKHFITIGSAGNNTLLLRGFEYDIKQATKGNDAVAKETFEQLSEDVRKALTF